MKNLVLMTILIGWCASFFGCVSPILYEQQELQAEEIAELRNIVKDLKEENISLILSNMVLNQLSNELNEKINDLTEEIEILERNDKVTKELFVIVRDIIELMDEKINRLKEEE